MLSLFDLSYDENSTLAGDFKKLCVGYESRLVIGIKFKH